MQRTDKTVNLLESPIAQGRTATEHSAAPAAHIHNSPRMAAQRQQLRSLFGAAAQVNQATSPPLPNHTGLPDNLKSGVESLAGMSLDHVKVHYNSSRPAQLNALAYAQGSDIHVAAGQEKHLPHEAWHVVQQAQGRVKPTIQMNDGMPVNDDVELEREADVMGARALQMREGPGGAPAVTAARAPAQRQADADKAGDGWAADQTVTWGKSEGKPVTVRVLARAFSNHFTPAWSGKIMAGVQSMWDDIKEKRDDGSLKTLSWGQYVVRGNTTHISYSVDYDSIRDEVVVKHAHAIQDGTAYPKQLTAAFAPSGTVADSSSALEVAQAARIDVGKVSVRYEQEGNDIVVYLPAGFPVDQREVIKQTLKRADLIFKNEPTDQVARAVTHQIVNPREPRKVEWAKNLITTYLQSVGVARIGEADVGALIAQAPVSFFEGHEWYNFLEEGGLLSSGLLEAGTTEGAVDPRRAVGERAVGINRAFHTVPAIVHELVHTLEHATLPSHLAEGMTEWIALQATGLDVRQTRSGGTLYSNETGIVKLAVARGAVTTRGLLSAYFFGDMTGIGRLKEAFRIFSELNQQTFAFQGLSATVQDPLRELEKRQW